MAQEPARDITEVSRRAILDVLSAEQTAWWGRLGEVEFLGRLYDLEGMPSTDHRFADAAGDIHQHRVNNWDWENDWVFYDPRFDLMRCPDDAFGRFLAEMCHPVVRPDVDEAKALAARFNEQLRPDNWELAETSQLSGRPVFEARARTSYRDTAGGLELDKYERLRDPQALQDHLTRIARDISSDPSGVIGSSKELVETVCKTILRDYEIEYSEASEVMELYKQVQDVLDLNASAIPTSRKGSQAAVKSLRALVTTIQSLAELRNAVGTGHGGTESSPALTRHARLAFNACVAVCEFLLDTWHVRRASQT